MPANLPTFKSLTAQVTARIAAEIEAGTWVDWLPGERALTETLRVSRKTVRKALAQLKRNGQITTELGQGHRIGVQAQPRRAGTESVGLLTLDPLERLRPFTALWVDELRALLFENHLSLALFSGHRFFSSRADTELARLVRQNPQSGWVLAHTDERVQQWFHDRRVPCILAGSGHRGLLLPSVDIDFFAVCRHAVGTMLRHGHRRIALLLRDSRRAGDLESAAGFLDGARQSGRSDVEARVVRHVDTVEAALRALARVFDRTDPPTALLIANPALYLTAISFLAERKLRVPHDVSLISRDDDAFLSYLTPLPARYSCSPRLFAKRLLPHVCTLAQGGAITDTLQRIEPQFIPGPSLASLPA
jgi:DNA-binding LacI/PurR family transcriptional regulator